MNKVLELERKLNLDKSKWKRTKLGTLAEEISVRVDNPASSGYTRFVGLDDFISGDIRISKWSTTQNLTSSAKAFQKRDILFARRNAYLRRASLVDFDGCCSGDAFVIRENHDKVVPGFLAFLFNSSDLWDYANSNAAGTMSKRVKWQDLAEFEFLLPPKEEQAKIAELLWAMDDLIANTYLMKFRLNLLKKTILKNLFSLNWTSKTPFLNKFSHQEFDLKKFSDLCSDSLFGPRFSSKMYDNNGNVACLRTTDMSLDGSINLETMPLAKLPEGKFREHYLKENDILISRSGTCGLTGVFKGFKIPVLPAAFIIRFRMKNEVNAEYIKTFFNSESGRAITNSLASGAVQKNLTGKSLLNIEIPLPKKSIQDGIMVMIENLGINECEYKISSTKSLQNSLINRIF